MTTPASPRWLLALESSTSRGGSALLRDGEVVATFLLEEGLRHGRELTASAGSLLADNGLTAKDLWGVAVSAGPGSYTGIRVGVMAAKTLAWGAGVRLAAVSSLAALAETLVLSQKAGEGDCIYTVQDARRDEVYAGLYRVRDGSAAPERESDKAVTPEEAALLLARLDGEHGSRLRLAGSSFATYSAVLGTLPSCPGRVDPAAVGVLGYRQILREETADPFALQPVYLRRDADADWRRDHLITQGK